MLQGQRTYFVLALMLVSLVVLAVFQYRWLGQVSVAEKERVRETMEASSRSFVGELSQVVRSVQNQFGIRVYSEDEDIATEMLEAYAKWTLNSNYPELVSKLFYVEHDAEGEAKLFLLDITKNTLDEVEWTEDLLSHKKQDNNKNDLSSGNFSINWTPDFGEPTYLTAPVQSVSLSNQESGSILLNLNVTRFSDYLMVELDDEILKNKVIPSISQSFFSDSYEDQFFINIVKPNDDSLIYYSSTDIQSPTLLPKPDVSNSIDLNKISSVIVFGQSDFNNTNFFESGNILDMIERSDKSFQVKSEYTTSFSDNGSYEFQHSNSTLNVKKADSARLATQQALIVARNSVSIDTTIKAGITIEKDEANDWQLWVTSKAGSIDALVTNARNKNMAISFFILMVLGICSFMIVAYSRKSEALAEQQMMFVAGVSHELRTPLSVIRSAADNMVDGLVTTQEKQQEYAKLVSKEGIRLSNMVDQILEYSGIQSGKKTFTFQLTDISAFIDQVAGELDDYIKEKGASLSINIDASVNSVQMDQNSIALCLNNLISNAIKFSSENKSISVDVKPAKNQEKSGINISVKDHGMGIPPEELSQIFDPFFRGSKPSAAQIKGNGIGLSLVNKIVAAHDGKVSVQSELDKGSKFTIWLPIQQTQDA